MIDIQKFIDEIVKMGTHYVPQLLLATVTLIIGIFIINNLVKLVKKVVKHRNMDDSLGSFLISLANIGLKVMLFISVADMVGIQTTSFIAVLGAAGFAVGMALQGSLANFAGGVLMLLFKPIKIGDFIEAHGHFGQVTSIQLFVTTIVTLDNRRVIMPNGELANSDLINYSAEGKIRVDMVIGIGYGEDIRTARDIIMKVLQDDPNVFDTPEPTVSVLELADSSVNLAVRPYTTADKYWAVHFNTMEKVKYGLDEAGIEIPFPQRVVHMVKE